MSLSARSLRLVGTLLLCGVSAVAATKPHYIVTNDDVPPKLPSSVTFYSVGTNGVLTRKATVNTGGNGVGGGFFGTQRVSVL